MTDTLRAALDWFRQRQRIRAGIAELSAMNAHQLDDLGITRDQITDYANGRLGRGEGLQAPRLTLAASRPVPGRCAA